MLLAEAGSHTIPPLYYMLIYMLDAGADYNLISDDNTLCRAQTAGAELQYNLKYRLNHVTDHTVKGAGYTDASKALHHPTWHYGLRPCNSWTLCLTLSLCALCCLSRSVYKAVPASLPAGVRGVE